MFDNGYFITFYPEIGYLLVLECPIDHVGSDRETTALAVYFERDTIFGTSSRPHGVFKTILIWLSRRNVHC